MSDLFKWKSGNIGGFCFKFEKLTIKYNILNTAVLSASEHGFRNDIAQPKNSILNVCCLGFNFEDTDQVPYVEYYF